MTAAAVYRLESRKDLACENDLIVELIIGTVRPVINSSIFPRARHGSKSLAFLYKFESVGIDDFGMGGGRARGVTRVSL